MLRSMITATNTMNQVQKQLDVIGHNLANVDTQGFKRTQTTFGEMVRQQFDSKIAPEQDISRKTVTGLRQGSGAQLMENIVFSQGSIKKTGRDLDFSFTKPGQFLKISADGQVRYTRDGALYLSNEADGQLGLVNANGQRVLDANNNPIVLNQTASTIKINADGTLTALDANGQPAGTFTLGIVQSNKPQALTHMSGNLYALANPNDPAAVTDAENAAIEQGALEMSNVDISKEMTEMLISQRAYQLNAKSVTLGDQMLGLINSVR
ncbi:flagellar hook-basal body complex protein [Bacillus mangrovi]|uniref:Flagellar hook-basal body complex protein n=1 Tax=Metabacillus mangrovi TaxID=1491830 RepID=A0A7X2S654_9BACI|nr:flagellar hook-basal body protein [Metabacillus mangrovi]MTH53978.1 flagellar hook-basal body complex protein [Metabacillus mangrovi]